MVRDASTCLDEDELVGFVAGELDSNRRRSALTHLDACDACRAVAAELARDLASVGAHKEECDLIGGRFRLSALVGRGAMGVVYRARDEKFGGDVALKLLASAKTSADELAREVRVGRRVTHPNVCRLHDAGVDGDRAYITMEFIEGETLAELLARGELDEARSIEILVDLANGLSAIHAAGIVHRDLKPANVIIAASSERAVLTDFGFAAEVESKQSRRVVGTPSFWAPEQARGERATPASDVYSLGLVAYRLLAHAEYSLSSELAAVPRRYQAFVGRCLASRPKDRFPDGEAALAGLLVRPRLRRELVVVPLLAIACALGGVRLTARIDPPNPAPPALVPSLSAVSASVASESTVPPRPRPAVPLVSSVPESSAPHATKPRLRHPPIAASGSAASALTASPAASEDPLYRH